MFPLFSLDANTLWEASWQLHQIYETPLYIFYFTASRINAYVMVSAALGSIKSYLLVILVEKKIGVDAKYIVIDSKSIMDKAERRNNVILLA